MSCILEVNIWVILYAVTFGTNLLQQLPTFTQKTSSENLMYSLGYMPLHSRDILIVLSFTLDAGDIPLLLGYV